MFIRTREFLPKLDVLNVLIILESIAILFLF